MSVDTRITMEEFAALKAAYPERVRPDGSLDITALGLSPSEEATIADVRARMKALSDYCDTLLDEAKKQAILDEVQKGLAIFAAALGTATGIGLVPLAAVPFIKVAIEAGNGIVKALETPSSSP